MKTETREISPPKVTNRFKSPTRYRKEKLPKAENSSPGFKKVRF